MTEDPHLMQLNLTCSATCNISDFSIQINDSRPTQPSGYPTQDDITNCVTELVVASHVISIPTDVEILNITCLAYDKNNTRYYSTFIWYPEPDPTSEPTSDSTNSKEPTTTSKLQLHVACM